VVEDNLSCVRETRLPTRSIDERLPHVFFEPFDSEGNSGLGTRQLDCRAGKTLLGRDGTKDLERKQIHGVFLL
jgi:hypothetical protein